MKTIYVFFAVITAFPQFIINASAQAPNTWTRKADFGGISRTSAVGFSIGGKGYIGTGMDKNDILTNDFWEYDTTTNTWTQKANFGGIPRTGAVGFSISTKGYIGTGFKWFPSIWLNDFWEYDPSSNIWTQKANFGGTPLEAAVGFSIGTKGYIGTGFNGNQLVNDFWEFDPSTNMWTRKADFGGTLRSSAVGFSIGTKGYIGTGFNGYQATNDFWEYDPSSNTWAQKANFGGNARYNAACFSIGTQGYIGTGMDRNNNFYNDFWEYDPSSDTWTQKANFGGVQRQGAFGFSIGNQGYVGTGNLVGFGFLNDFWEYTPSCDLPASPTNTTPAANQTICSGNSTILTASGTGTLGWYSAATGGIWLGGGTSNTTPVLTTDTAYYVQDSTCWASQTRTRIPVTVNPLPVPTLSGSDSTCGNSSGNVYTTQTGMTGYSWMVSPGGTITNGGTPTSSSATVTWNSVGDKTVSVSYTNSNGCTASAPAQFHVFLDSITVPGIVTGGSTISLGFSTDSLFATRYHGLILGWQKRHNGGMYTVIPNTGGHVSYIEIPDSTGTYDYQVLVKNGHCDTETSTSTTVTVIDGPVSRYWTGAVDIYWNKAGNWNPVGVPTYLDDVVIPGTVSNQPVVIIQGLACHNMNIVTGATVTINPGITLTINGNLTIGP